MGRQRRGRATDQDRTCRSSCTAHRGRNNTRGRSPGSQQEDELPGLTPSRAVVHAQWLYSIRPDAERLKSLLHRWLQLRGQRRNLPRKATPASRFIPFARQTREQNTSSNEKRPRVDPGARSSIPHVNAFGSQRAGRQTQKLSRAEAQRKAKAPPGRQAGENSDIPVFNRRLGHDREAGLKSAGIGH